MLTNSSELWLMADSHIYRVEVQGYLGPTAGSRDTEAKVVKRGVYVCVCV